ncbi:MAG TPA: hypothetical protein VGC89_16110 [Pyrinomonadaceae bacterium]
MKDARISASLSEAVLTAGIHFPQAPNTSETSVEEAIVVCRGDALGVASRMLPIQPDFFRVLY